SGTETGRKISCFEGESAASAALVARSRKINPATNPRIMNRTKWILFLNDITHLFRCKSLFPGDSSIQHNLSTVIAEFGKSGHTNRDPSLDVQARPRFPPGLRQRKTMSNLQTSSGSSLLVSDLNPSTNHSRYCSSHSPV